MRREASGQAASLVWLVSRSRPDMARVYNTVASPKAAAARVRHMLGYLKLSCEIGLMYVRRNTPDVIDPTHVFAGASFAPTGSASHGGSV